MSTILNFLILDIPTYLMIIGFEGKQPLEEVLSLTILVLIALALLIAPVYMLYERFMGGESFRKCCVYVGKHGHKGRNRNKIKGAFTESCSCS
jgi:hypothetical protein